MNENIPLWSLAVAKDGQKNGLKPMVYAGIPISLSSRSNSSEKVMASHSLMFLSNEYKEGVKADTRRSEGLVAIVGAREGEGGVSR